MATSRKRPNRNRTASARKRGRGGSFEKRVKQFWKQNKTLIKGGLQFLAIALVVFVIAIPFMRVDNPGNTYGIDVSSTMGPFAGTKSPRTVSSSRSSEPGPVPRAPGRSIGTLSSNAT